MGHLPVAEEVEQGCGRRSSGEGPIVADVGPQPRRARSALRQQRHRGVVPVQPPGAEDVVAYQRVNRRKRGGAGANLVGQGREAEIDTLPGVALGLPVQGLMLAELLEKHHRQQVRASPSARRCVERRRRLADFLASPASELLADGLDHLPLSRNDLQRLGDILPHLHDAIRSAARTRHRRLEHHALARQVLREGLPGRTAALEPRNRRGLHRRLRGDLVLGRGGLEFFELQLHLVDQTRAAFRAVAILLPPQPGDLEPEVLDHRLGGRDHRPSLRQLALGRLGTGFRGRERGAQLDDLGRHHQACPKPVTRTPRCP